MAARELFVLRYPAHLFAAHMALFIPHADNKDIGKVIHATGDSRMGFEQEVKRNYDAVDSTRRPVRYALGTVDAGLVEDVVGNGELVIENPPVAQDEIERIVLTVPAPGPSLRKASDGPVQGKVEIKNCQTWLREVISLLVDRTVLDAEALVKFDAIPR